jgi:hypothetical protein
MRDEEEMAAMRGILCAIAVACVFWAVVLSLLGAFGSEW